MPEQDCPHIDNCEMYKLLRMAGTLAVWKTRYCCSDYERCARYKLSQQGKHVPANLMPSGALLKTAKGS